MTNKVITLTIPSDDALAAHAASEFFSLLSDGLYSCDAAAESRQIQEAKKANKTEAKLPKAEDEGDVLPLGEPQKTAYASSEDDGDAPDGGEYPITVNGIQLDFDRIPWDARIHSSNKKVRKADNRWTPKRGVDQDLYNKVTEELKQFASGRMPAKGPDTPEPEPQEGQKFNAGSAFGAKPQQDNVTTPQEFFEKIGAEQFPDSVMSKVCGEYNWPSVSMAVVALASNKEIFNEVLAKLRVYRAEGV